ncbi:hypothetical protein H0A73_12525 [Alcaligenaceae bacterium]|nr:hypothetical protein [Alcaligenaceae bacterium]
MKILYRYLAVSVVAVFLAGCSSIQTKQGDSTMNTQQRSGGFMGLSTKDDVEVQLAQAFAGVNKVIIGGFKVGFNDSKRYEEKRGGALSRASVATALVKLQGIDQATRQAITDHLYAQFVQKLQDKGYQVLPREPLLAYPAYAKVTEAEFPYKVDQSGLFSSYGVGYYYSPTPIGKKQAFFPGENDPSFMAGFGGLGLLDAADRFGHENDVRVLGVAFMVDFAGASEGGYFSTTHLEIGQLMAVDRGSLVMSRNETGIRTATIAQLNLGQPVGSSIPFASIENVTTDGDVAAQAAANAVTGLLSGGILGAFTSQANQTREFVFNAEPAKYIEAAQDALGQASTRLVDTMAGLR